MPKKNRNGVNYPKGFMKIMKKQKKKKIRNTPIDKIIVEQESNNAEREI